MAFFRRITAALAAQAEHQRLMQRVWLCQQDRWHNRRFAPQDAERGR